MSLVWNVQSTLVARSYTPRQDRGQDNNMKYIYLDIHMFKASLKWDGVQAPE